MSLKKELKKIFSKSDKILELRKESVNIFFLISVLFFSLNFFFIGARFYLDFNINIFTYIYMVFVLSLSLLFFFSIYSKFKDKIKKGGLYGLSFFSILLFFFLSVPVIFPKDKLFSFLGL